MFRENVSDDTLRNSRVTHDQEDLPSMKVASFFSGIGGFERAFESEGSTVVFQCENDKFCRAVLQRHWPNAPTNEDIRKLSSADIPHADVWTAGFPCQDVSLARGNHGRSGLRGNHTSLFFTLANLVSEKRPEVLLLENVVGLLNSHKGHDFALILRELTSLGYAVSWRVMNARYFGAPQSRPRVFLCAWKGDFRKAIRALFEEKAGAKPPKERAAFVTEQKHKKTNATVAQIAYCVSATSGRHTGLDWARSYVSYPKRVRRPTPTESERLQGFPTDWTVPGEEFVPPARGLDSERYRATGNAVAVPVVQWIAKRLSNCFQEKLGSASDESLYDFALSNAPDIGRQTNMLDFDDIEAALEAGDFVHRWRSGGCAFGKMIIEGQASSAPSKIIESYFVDALDITEPDERYFLSANAAVGILRRADAQGRNLFPPMRRALEILVNAAKVNSLKRNEKRRDAVAQTRIRKARSEQR